LRIALDKAGTADPKMNDNLPRQVPEQGGKFEFKAVFCQA
jgi:hypothetical protein